MTENVKYLNDENFNNTVANEGVTVVDFYADWCGPCRMITPIIEELADEMKGKATVAKLDIEHAQQTTAEFQVMSIPTIIIFKKGKEYKRIVGIKGKADLKAAIESAL